jgi:hypothetical protein
MYVNSGNTNYHKQICTDLRSTDSKKTSSFEKRTPSLSPIVEVDDGDEDDNDDEEEEDDSKLLNKILNSLTLA